MLNNKESKCGLVNTSSLSIMHSNNDYNSFRRAAAASERLLCSASLLPEGSFLGWQIDTKASANSVFSSPGVIASLEDFNWIFDRCAEAYPLVSSEWMEGFYAEGRKLYMLSPITGENDEGKTCNFSYNDFDEMPPTYLYYDMFKMLSEAEAMIRITAHSAAEEAKGHGRIFISTPGKMSLRMMSMICIALHMAPEEIGTLEEADGTEYLPDDYFLAGMISILSSLVYKNEPERENEEDYDTEDISEDDPEINTDDEEEPDAAPIDELELSIRSYNCLKRAGISTVEELRALSDEDLMNVRSLGKKGMEEIREKLAELRMSVPLTETDYMVRLDELIGLVNVKEQIRKIAAFAKMKQDMLKNKNADISLSFNMAFVGNPGTAKTTVARITAGIFYEIGLLPCNEMIEAGRADLVGKYTGHTAVKVKDVFRKAKGKVLFIDEAYSLVDDREGSFGDEAINTLIQEMENNRNDTVVILAGYPKKMEDFFSRNPGLRSRVPFTVNFSDYSVEEMVKIAELEAGKRGFSIETEAYGKVAALCAEAALYPDMGNGRFCRNLIENAVLSYASRVYGNDDTGGDKNYTLTAGDFAFPTVVNSTKKSQIGFHA